MILIMSEQATIDDVNQLKSRLEKMGFTTMLHHEASQIHIAIIDGIDAQTETEHFIQLPLVEKVVPMHDKYKLSSRTFKRSRTILNIGHVAIGSNELVVMAGPCSVESEKQIHAIAKVVSQQGAQILRGGAFKPRTSPYDFQGLGEPGLIYMQQAAKDNGLLTISEVMSENDVDLVAKYIDILQIGARNMQNFNLLKAIGQTKKPTLLKRGPSATYQELLLAAEYIISSGNPNVMLCERGIRTFETYSRNTLDVAAVPILHELSHLPVIIDPSHGTGLRNMVAPMACAGVAAGADGVIVEVHTDPDKSMTDAKQAISPEMFANMMHSLKRIKSAIIEDKTTVCV